MEKYRNEIRIPVLAGQGNLDTSALEKPAPLDQAITKLALRVLEPRELQAFYFAYGCRNSWEEIADEFESRLGRALDVDTVKRYATDAKSTIISRAAAAPEFRNLKQLEISSADEPGMSLAAMMVGSAANAFRNGSFGDAISYLRAILTDEVGKIVPLVEAQVDLINSQVVSLHMTWLSPKANEFYDLPPESKRLFGAEALTLLERLKPWMGRRDYDSLIADQERTLRQFEEERFAIAEVPAVLNSKHPRPEFRNRRFMPVIAQIDELPTSGDVESHRAIVVYAEEELIRLQ